MNNKIFKLCIVIISILTISLCSHTVNENIINKVNVVSNHWVNYQGISENDNNMIQSQFIPYNPKKNYEVSHDTYISYFNGDEFIKTELYEDTPEIINSVEEADGIILSFNKENKSGVQLTKN